MKIYLIVVKEPGEEPYIQNAWDEYSRDDNPSGFREHVELAKKGATSKAEVRVGTVVIHNGDDFLESLFHPVECEAARVSAKDEGEQQGEQQGE